MDGPTEVEQTDEPVSNKWTKKNSRWVDGSTVPRYDKQSYEALASFVEPQGWHRGARIKRLNDKEEVK